MVVFFCTDCGKEVNTGMKFCGNCGAALHPSSDGVASAQTPTSSPCPSGQELREERWDATRIKSRVCVGPDGEPEGLATQWHANGQKSSEGTWRDGEREGLRTMWHENGQKSREETFRDGTSTSVTRWDESGNQITR